MEVPKGKKNKLIIGLAAASSVAILLMGWWMLRSHQPESPWKPTTVPYDSKCEGECLKNLQELADIETSHLMGVKIVVRPDVNDAIAQLGDCLDSISGCIDSKGDPSQTATCVSKSQCPKPCRDDYAKRFNGGMSAEQQMNGVEAIFLADNAICAPREAKAN